jgi:hypothetical protein
MGRLGASQKKPAAKRMISDEQRAWIEMARRVLDRMTHHIREGRI